MKKLLFTFLLSAITACAFSQSIHFGLKGGVNLSTLAISGSVINIKNQNLTGFNAGVIAEFGLGKLFLQPGLFFSTKGNAVHNQLVLVPQGANGVTYVTISNKIRLDYLEVPVNLLYKIHTAPGISVKLGGGPYFGEGLSGKGTVSGYVNETFPASFNKNSKDVLIYKNPDYGLNFLAGIELKKKILIDAGYGLGLANLAYGDARNRNRVISFSVGYLF